MENQPNDTYRRRRILKAASVAAGSAALAGCSGGDSDTSGGSESGSDSGSSTDSESDGSSSDSRHGGSMTFALGGSPTNLSYWQSYDTVTNNLTTQIWDSLLEYSEPDMELQPALAESWEATDDTTYVYELREGVTFHDGSEMTAEDVIASAELTLRDEARSPLAWMFGAVDNFERIDEYTVQVNMSEVDASFQYVPATTAWSVAPASLIEERGIDLAQDPVGAGPFQFEEWQSGNYVRLTRHDDYWDGDLPYLDEATFQIVPNGTSRITGLQNGNYGGTNDIPIDQLSVLDNIDNVELYTATSYQTSHLAFNCMEGPFSDPDVRRAASYAIDTQAITDSVVGEYGSHATSMLPEGMMGHVTPEDLEYNGFPYDPERAQTMLDEAGHTGSPRFEATLMTPTDTVRQRPAIAIQEYLSEVGIDVSVSEVSQSTYVDTIWGEEDFSERPDMQMTLWASDYPSPDAIIRPLFDSEQLPPSNNWFGYQNEEVDELLQQFKTTLDTEERAEYATQANQMVVDDAPGVWIFHPDTTKAFNTKFEGYDGQVPAFVTYFTTFLRDMYISE